MIRRALAFAFVGLVIASVASAEQDRNQLKGFTPEGVFQFLGLDNVNIFNGNLVLTIPIGQPYPIASGLSYQFQLVCNGNVWDSEIADGVCDHRVSTDPSCVPISAIPDRRANAGMGCLVSLGRLFPPQHVTTSEATSRWVYESPDAAEHFFFKTLRCPDGSEACDDDEAEYTRDGSYLRMQVVGSQRWVEFPDGAVHEFEPSGAPASDVWRLVKITNRFSANYLQIEYPENGLEWKITDSRNREHRIQFEMKAIDGSQVPMVKSVELEVASTEGAASSQVSADGERVLYSFTYTPDDHELAVPYWDTDDDGAILSNDRVEVPLLKKLTLPDDTAFMLDHLNNSTLATSGLPYRLRLPTQGCIAWDWGWYSKPAPDPLGFPHLQGSSGIKRRIVSARDCPDPWDQNQEGLGVWTYAPELTPEAPDSPPCDPVPPGELPPECDSEREMKSRVTDPLGNYTLHFFSVAPLSVEGWREEEYGAPFTRYVTDSEGRFLSREIYECPKDSSGECIVGSEASGQLLRQEFVEYESDLGLPFFYSYGNSFFVNTRLVSSRTVFSDDGDHFIDTNHSDFDGYGHYRTTEQSGFTSGAPGRRTTTRYNPESASTGLTTDDSWILNSYDLTEVSEGGVTRKVESAFDPVTGVLEATRVLGGDEDCVDDRCGDDVLTILVHDTQGNVIEEKVYGGDGAELGTSDCCTEPASDPSYLIRKGYSHGVLAKSEYLDPEVCSGSVCESLLTTIDYDIDSSTGLVLTSRDPAGVATTYGYDALSRLREVVTPTANGQATTEYVYSPATSSTSATVTETVTDSNGLELTRARFDFDDIGRFTLGSKTLPGGKVAAVEMKYDLLGRKTAVSQPVGMDDHPVGSIVGSWTKFRYDPFGRQTKITAPDGAVTTFDYTGVREMSRTTSVLTPGGVADATTTEHYDPWGRLVKVEEDAVETTAETPSGAKATTDYTYDSGGPLTTVTMDDGTRSQLRSFEYDGRRFLVGEDHPESGATTYGKHDPRGRAGERTSGGTTLLFTYDAAERLRRIARSSGEPIKEFVFGTDPDNRKGKLVTAVRYNRLAGAGTIVVTESYEYDKPNGQMSRRHTLVERMNPDETRTEIQQFVYAVNEYDDLGALRQIAMPTCALHGCATAGAIPTVEFERSAGYLTGVAGFATLTYHPSGMVASVRHQTPNSLTDIYDESNGIPRPAKITFDGVLEAPCPVPTPSIHAPGSTCPLALTTASVNAEQGATYAWTITGGTLEAGTPSDTETILFRANGPDPVHLSVAVTNACGTVTVSTDVAVDPAPVPPVITVPATVTMGSAVYDASVMPVSGESYSWTISAGGVMVSSTGPAVQFTVPSVGPPTTAVTLTVTVTAACGAPEAFERTILVQSEPLAPCSAEWNPGLDDWILAADPPETISLTAGLAFVAPAPVPDGMILPTAFQYSFQWFESDVLVQTADRQPESSSTYPLQFTGRSHVRVVATLTCQYETVNKEATAAELVGQTDVCAAPAQRSITATILNATTVRLEVPDDGDGVTFQWYEGSIYSDLSLPLGTTAAITVPVGSPKTYWVKMKWTCGSVVLETNTAFFLVDASSKAVIFVQPQHVSSGLPTGGSSVALTTSVVAGEQGPFKYQWYTAADDPIADATDPSYTWTYSGTGPFEQQSVYVKVRRCLADGITCGLPVQSDTVTLTVTEAPQKIYGYTPGETLHGAYPATLSVQMEPEASSDHLYTYEWFEDDGTPGGKSLSSTTSSINVLPSGMGIYWARITGRHTLGGSTYTDITISPKMFVDQYGDCELPPLRVASSHGPIAIGSSPPVTFQAFCDWYNVEFEWYVGLAGDTRNQITADAATPNRLTVDSAAIRPHWVRAKLPCGATRDSDTLSYTRGACAPVVFDQRIASVEVAHGAAAILSVAPVTLPNPDYDWYEEGGSVPVGSGTSFTIPSATESGRYFVSVRDRDCSTATDSFIATVRVASCPTLTPPQWQTEVWTDKGMATDLTATTGGATSYQWFLGEVGDDSSPIGGATLPTYTTLPLSEDTKYWVRAFGNGCMIDSPTMTVKVCELPVPLGVPHYNYNSSVPDQPAFLGVSMAGTNLQYQWYVGQKGDTSMPTGRPFDTLLVRPLETTQYWVKVTALCGVDGNAPRSWSSETFTVSVCPSFDAAPVASKTLVMPGTTTTLFVDVDRGDTVKWFMISTPGGDATEIPGSGPSVTTPPINGPTTFFARATSGGCTKDSERITIEVCSSPTVHWFTVNPTQVARGEQFFLRAGLAFGEVANFAWYRGTSSGDVAGSTLVYQSSNAYQLSLQETASFWVRAWDEQTGCYSDSTLHTVEVCIPTIVTQPQPVEIIVGGSTTLSVATDIPATGYQWYIGESGDITTPVAGGTGAVLTVAPTADTKYWVRVKGCGLREIDSAAALVTVCTPATVASHTQSALIFKGTTRELWVEGGGTDVTCRWYRGTQGDTTTQIGSSCSVFVTPLDTTSYWARVSGRCGAADTGTVVVSVCDTPVITTQPASHRVFSGTSTTLSVGATQSTSTPMSYQWYSGTGTSSPIAGATAATYVTPPLTAAATYWVRVIAGAGICSVDSAPATVSMCAYDPILNGPNDKDIAVGQTVRLDALISPVPDQVRWYRGTQGDKSNLISSLSYADVSPTVTTQYWGEFTHEGCVTKSRTVTVYVSIPTITQQPAASTQVNGGQSATLTVAANTTGLSYQWYSGTSGSGTAIGGATGSTYVTPALAGGSSASYWVKVIGSRGHEVNSETASVTWCLPASISLHPQSYSIRRGTSASLVVGTTGTNLRYQWYRSTSPSETNAVGGATSPNYSVSLPPDSVSYWVKVTSDCGVANSTTARIDVCDDPIVNTQPASQTIHAGGTVTLSVTATSGTSMPLSYQWYTGTSGSGTAISGATGSTFTTPVLTATTSYWVKVTSGVCSTNSVTATVSMCAYPPTINGPDDRDIAVGQTVRLSVNLSPVPQQYRWYRGTQGDKTYLISSASYIDVSPAVTTQYWAEFTHNGCTAKSRTVTVWVSIPTITQQPAVSTQVIAGQSATLTVAANTTGLTYQWYGGTSGSGTAISGATGSTYVTPALAGGSSASYWVKVTGSRGHSVNSDTASVTWCLPASISLHPQSYSIRRGTSASLVVGATGTNLRYQWYRATSPSETNAVGGATSPNYSVSLPPDSVSYWVKVTSDCGVANSTTARIDVCDDPIINTQPGSPTINTGSTATLTVAATSATSMPLSYQWYTGTSGSGTPIPGETGATYTTPALTAAANYWVKVTSGVCSTNSATAVVSICPYPATLNKPLDRYVKRGVATLLTVSGLSPTPQTYAWYRGAQGNRTTLLSNAPSFNVYPTVTTQYWGEFTYNGCTTMSRTVTINVCVPTITSQPQSQSVTPGTAATMSVTATEASTYQWYRGKYPSLIPGATGASYTTPTSHSTDYYWVEVTGSCGVSTRSDYVDVTVAW